MWPTTLDLLGISWSRGSRVEAMYKCVQNRDLILISCCVYLFLGKAKLEVTLGRKSRMYVDQPGFWNHAEDSKRIRS